MVIDNNPKEKEDQCNCEAACKYHGRCMECVAIHRAHREHLPNCFKSMVNERIEKLSELTERSIIEQIKKAYLRCIIYSLFFTHLHKESAIIRLTLLI